MLWELYTFPQVSPAVFRTSDHSKSISWRESFWSCKLSLRVSLQGWALDEKKEVAPSCSAPLLARQRVRKGWCTSVTRISVLLLRQFYLQGDCLMNTLSLKDEGTNGGWQGWKMWIICAMCSVPSGITATGDWGCVLPNWNVCTYKTEKKGDSEDFHSVLDNAIVCWIKRDMCVDGKVVYVLDHSVFLRICFCWNSVGFDLSRCRMSVGPGNSSSDLKTAVSYMSFYFRSQMRSKNKYQMSFKDVYFPLFHYS